MPAYGSGTRRPRRGRRRTVGAALTAAMAAGLVTAGAAVASPPGHDVQRVGSPTSASVHRSAQPGGAEPAPSPTVSPPTATPSTAGVAPAPGASSTYTSPTPEPSPSGVGVIPFGPDYGVLWEDQVQASVLAVERYEPAASAVGLQPGHVGVKVTVRIVNGSEDPIDVTLATVELTPGPDAPPAERVFDVENGIGAGFDGEVAAGSASTSVYGFSVAPDRLDLVDVDVAPTIDHAIVVFEGAVS